MTWSWLHSIHLFYHHFRVVVWLGPIPAAKGVLHFGLAAHLLTVGCHFNYYLLKQWQGQTFTPTVILETPINPTWMSLDRCRTCRRTCKLGAWPCSHTDHWKRRGTELTWWWYSMGWARAGNCGRDEGLTAHPTACWMCWRVWAELSVTAWSYAVIDLLIITNESYYYYDSLVQNW